MKSARFLRVVFMALLTVTALSSAAQPNTDGQKVTPQTARKKEADALEKKQNEYQSRKDHHLEAQDKATRKRASSPGGKMFRGTNAGFDAGNDFAAILQYSRNQRFAHSLKKSLHVLRNPLFFANL
jgi:hypothetical protein